jgi:NAD(P)-dependent dehydrogenase (short-subunit alcohol dehydrogenase family)
MNLDLKGKIAIVTGGSRGIGKAIASQLAQEGVDIALVARDQIANEVTASELKKATHQRILPFQADTGDDQSVRTMIDGVVAAFGRIDILVNAAAKPAGQSKPPQLAEITNDDFWTDMNVKVLGYLRMARAVVPHMKQQGFGRIINISGLGARLTGSIIGSMRNVSVVAMTKNLADELSGSGINVTCVHPGLTRTEKTRSVIESQSKALGITESEVEQRLASSNLLGRLVTADEVAYAVTFLASPRSISINGDVIAVGGGMRGAIYY